MVKVCLRENLGAKIGKFPGFCQISSQPCEQRNPRDFQRPQKGSKLR